MLYRRILLPTDGSRRAAKGVKTGIALAHALGARVLGLYVVPKDSALEYGAAALYGARLVLGHVESAAAARAKKALGRVLAAAKKAGVPCSVEVAQDDRPWRGMLRVARKRKCDLIVLGSTGRSALGGVLVRGEAARLLSRSRIAMLVVR